MIFHLKENNFVDRNKEYFNKINQIDKENKQRNLQIRTFLHDSFIHLQSLKECDNDYELEWEKVINKAIQMTLSNIKSIEEEFK